MFCLTALPLKWYFLILQMKRVWGPMRTGSAGCWSLDRGQLKSSRKTLQGTGLSLPPPLMPHRDSGTPETTRQVPVLPATVRVEMGTVGSRGSRRMRASDLDPPHPPAYSHDTADTGGPSVVPATLVCGSSECRQSRTTAREQATFQPGPEPSAAVISIRPVLHLRSD